MRNKTYSQIAETIYNWRFPSLSLSLAMIPVVIILLLLTALVATEPSSSDGGEK